MKVINPVTITDAMLVSSTVAATDYAVFNAASNYAIGDPVTYPATNHNYELATSPAKVVTISTATPALVTSAAHGFEAGTPVVLSTTGALPTGLVAGTTYYIKNPTTDAYQLSAAVGGAAINTSGAQNGVHTATARPLPTNASYWVDLGATNQRAMFDNVVGTATVSASPLTVVTKPGTVGGLGMLELVGRQLHVTMKDQTGGTVVYDKTVDLDGTIIESVYDWFFADFEQRSDVVMTDLPAQFPNCELTISITATSGNAACGVCKPGTVIDIGNTLAGAKVSIVDYSTKETDEFGNTYFVERAYSKEGNFDVLTSAARFNRIFRTLASLRAKPAMYIGTESPGKEPLLIYGRYVDFSIAVEYQTHHLCSLEIEGLI